MDFNKIIESYLEDNPDIPKEDLVEISKLFYTFIREEMESGNLNQIRIKYFGSFRPLLGKLKHLKHNINWDKFGPKEKNRYIKLLENYDRIAKEIEEKPL